MDIKEGSDVYNTEGNKVGAVHRVVIDPGSKEVTHLIVQKGFLFKTDKVLSIDMIDSEDGDRLILKKDVQDLDGLPDFADKEYVMLDPRDLPSQVYGQPGYVPPVYFYPAFGSTAMGGPTLPTTPTAVVPTGKFMNIPDDTIPLKEGSKVISSDGDHVGNLDKVLISPENNRATHFVISDGILFKERKIIPVGWVNDITMDRVELMVGSHFLDRLPKYEDA